MKFSVKGVFAFGALSLLSGFVGCGGGDATVKPKFIAAPSTRALISLENLNDPFERWLAPAIESTEIRTTPQVAQTTATSITSLQYYIQSIQLCESITTTGTGYSSTSGCINLYVNEDSQDTSLYNSYTITEASTDTDPNHFIDFLTEEGRARLEVSQAVDSGTYNYALINFMRPIKIKAEFKNTSGTTLHRTKSGGTIVSLGNDEGGREMEAIKPANTHTGDAELMTYMLNNGGTWFPLLSPFVIAPGDDVILDFVYNPENFATTTETSAGCASSPSSSGPYVYDEGNCVTFNLPYAKMAPVPRKSGESTKKEVYLITDWATGSEASDVRVEIYYNSADTAKSIRGADAALVMKSGATQGSTNTISTYRATQTGNEVTFYAYNSSSGQIDAPNLVLTRGASGTATITCLFTGGPCTSTGQEVTKSYTYVGDVTVED